MADDGIRERHGVTARKVGFSNAHPLTFWEDGQSIVLEDTRDDMAMSPAQARYVARKLYRLARRVEQRQQGGE